MPGQNRNRTHRWKGGWRRRRIEPSPDFAQFLVGEIDSHEYARLLMRPRKTAGIQIKTKPRGPIARAHEEAVARGFRDDSNVVSRAAQVSPEYFRFLREEISSSDYADAVTDCAKLEGLYRAPAAGFSFPRRGAAELVMDGLRLFFVIVGVAMAIFGLLPVLASIGTAIAGSIMHWAWTMSIVGAVLLAVTVLGEVSSLLQNGAHFIQRLVGAHQ